LGVKHGRIVANGGTPHIKNPVTAVKEAVKHAEVEKETKEIDIQLTSAMNYSRKTAMDALAKERETRAKGRG
jgi:hypothetical protein